MASSVFVPAQRVAVREIFVSLILVLGLRLPKLQHLASALAVLEQTQVLVDAQPAVVEGLEGLKGAEGAVPFSLVLVLRQAEPSQA